MHTGLGGNSWVTLHLATETMTRGADSLVGLGIFTEEVQEEYLPTLHHLDDAERDVVGGIALLEEHTVVGVGDESLGGASHKLGVLPTQRDEGDGQ